MRRTRKWAFVEQEAKRLASLGLSGYAIAKQLGVNESSVSRWRKSGKLARKEQPVGNRQALVGAGSVMTPEEWAKAVRGDYALDATDEQLVNLAEAELRKAFDPSVSPGVRSTAAGRFQALVRQLALARNAPEVSVPTEPPKRQTFQPQKRSGRDPRALLTAVK
jgi:hypothetical protein